MPQSKVGGVKNSQNRRNGKSCSKGRGDGTSKGQPENHIENDDALRTLAENKGQPITAPVMRVEHEYTEREQASLREFARKLERRPPKFTSPKNDELEGKFDKLLFQAGLSEAFGTSDQELAVSLLAQVSHTVTSEDSDSKLNRPLAALHGIQPANTLEGLLAVQMVGVHNLAMTFMGRAVVKDQPIDIVDRNVNRATRLLRTFVAQMEALNRMRGKVAQTVVVKHVHVYEGGQAIVGTVTQNNLSEGRGEGGGGNAET
ncbi:MAG: hypothetical protein ACLQVM_06725 [Terriglobia bacterium]